MPEMLGFVGRRFRVTRRAEKICDYRGESFSSGGCAGTPCSSTISVATGPATTVAVPGAASTGRRSGCAGSIPAPSPLRWSRQTWKRSTRALARRREPGGRSTAKTSTSIAARPRRRWLRRASARLRSAPVCARDHLRQRRTVHAAWVLGRAVVHRWAQRLGLRSAMPLSPVATPATQPQRLDLQPGELVQIRPRDEIAATLDERGKCRGLWFDVEMAPHCGNTYRVQGRVERFIDETNGRMIELSSDCLILDGVTCSGERSSWRYFCHRAIYPWWREAWLRRVDGDEGRSDPSRAG